MRASMSARDGRCRPRARAAVSVPAGAGRAATFCRRRSGRAPSIWAIGRSTTRPRPRSLVAAAYARRARRFVTLEATCEGNPALRVGTHVTIEGVGPRFANTYYVTSTCHRFDRAVGYQTDFTAECGYFGG